MTAKIPLLRPCLPTADELLPYLKEIDQSAWYSNFGPLNERFIKRIEVYQELRWSNPVFCLTTSSGTLALELLISALDLPRSSNIFIPAFTFVATASAVLRCGHKPVLCDVDPKTWLLTPEMLSCGDFWYASACRFVAAMASENRGSSDY
jgi:dTDP-4-amino-4,6-dideoxygalactose transaminase